MQNYYVNSEYFLILGLVPNIQILKPVLVAAGTAI